MKKYSGGEFKKVMDFSDEINGMYFYMYVKIVMATS